MLSALWRLMRFDKPIGIFLLLWPTYWALWLANGGLPSLQNVLVFTLGTVLMRAAGCVINDIADREFDGKVTRLSIYEACIMSKVDESYLWCKRVCKKSKSSFVPAFGLVDHHRRNAMYALYAFARVSDDLADDGYSTNSQDTNSGIQFANLNVQSKAAILDAWRQRLEKALGLPAATGSNEKTDQLEQTSISQQAIASYEPLWPALADSTNRFSIPSQYLTEIIDGVAMDLEPKQPETMAELRDYCYLVASAVGLACTYIWKESDEVDVEAAVECGIAFQLTNILRDVREDAQQNRIYLPKELFEKHEVDENSWFAQKPSGGWQAMMQEVASEADRLYMSGWKTIRNLENNSQRMFSLMWRGYHDLLHVVHRDLELTWNRPSKAKLGMKDKLFLLGSHYVGPLYKSLPCPTVSES